MSDVIWDLDDYEFSEEAIEKCVREERPKEGKHAMLLMTATPYQSKREGREDDIIIKLGLKKLQNPSDPNTIMGRTIINLLTLPLENTKVPGHKVDPRDVRNANRVLHALLPEDVPAIPVWDRDLGSYVYKGEEIEQEAVEAAKREAAYATKTKTLDLLKDTSAPFAEVIGSVVYVDLSYGKTNFPNLYTWHAECPDDWTLEEDATEYVSTSGEVAAKAEEDPEPKKPAKRRRRK